MSTVTTLTYGIGTVSMLVGVGIALKLATESGTEGRFGYLLAIPGFAAIAYAMMTLGIGTMSFQGYLVPVPRYVDWLLTTPVLVGYAAYVAGAGRNWILGAALADAMMIITGGVAVVLSAPGRWLAFGVSSAFYIGLLGIIYQVLPNYAAEQNSKRRRLAEILRNHVGLLWLTYPVVWVFGPGLQIVSATAIAMIIAYLDVVAKVPYVYLVYRARECFGEGDAPSPEPGSSGQNTVLGAD